MPAKSRVSVGPLEESPSDPRQEIVQRDRGLDAGIFDPLGSVVPTYGVGSPECWAAVIDPIQRFSLVLEVAGTPTAA